MIERLQQRIPLFWLLQFGGWGAFGVGMALSRLGMFPLWYMAINKGVLTLLGFGLSLVLRSLYRRVRTRSRSPVAQLALIVAGSYVCTLFWTVSFGVTITWINSVLRDDPFVINRFLQLVDGLLYLTFVMIAWSVLYFAIKYYQDLQIERERALKAEALAQSARLRALRYQLNPHFLFNSLNAISTLIVEGENRAAGRMVAGLGDFLRLTLDGSDEEEVPLIEEIEFARRYLDIEKIRFGDRLEVLIDVTPDTYSALVPTLILQPLIENAVRHAIAPREKGGRIDIQARRTGDSLYLRVQDDGPGLADTDVAFRKGIGLANTQARLEELYSGHHRFELLNGNGVGLSVVLTIPWRTLSDDTASDPAPGMPGREQTTE